jgi:uncharacterized protein
MNAVFVDTAFYVAMLSTRDAFHRSATAFLANFDGLSVTTEYVLVEVGNFCSGIGKRRAFVDLVRGLEASSMTDVVPSSQELFERGLALFEARVDKEWSVTDCISFAVMTERGLTDALASDRHFGQAGFSALLTSE